MENKPTSYHDQLRKQSRQHPNEHRESKPKCVRGRIESRQPEHAEHEINESRCKRSRASGRPPQYRGAPCDHQERCEIRKNYAARNVIAQRTNRLMSSLKITPDQIEDPSTDSRQRIQINPESAYHMSVVVP